MCNVYGPSDRRARESFFDSLTDIDVGDYDQVLVGGDFNCTQSSLDRDGAQGRHRSPALDRLLQAWQLVDVADDEKRQAERTYHYMTASGRWTSRVV